MNSSMRWHRALSMLCLITATLSMVTGGRAAWLSGKATVAQIMLERAWSQTLTTGSNSKPWPWSDTYPVARLYIPSTGDSLIVLNNASGEAMAFGPGLVLGKPAQAASQVVAIGGHRDTHLAVLENLATGTRFDLQNRKGQWFRYRFDDARVVDSRINTVAINQQQAGLVLITCYPFSATQTGGPLRYVVSATPTAAIAAPFAVEALEPLAQQVL